MTFKFCNLCTAHYRKPLKVTRRKCPVCGSNVFRKPTDEEIKAHDEDAKRREDFIMSLAQEED